MSACLDGCGGGCIALFLPSFPDVSSGPRTSSAYSSHGPTLDQGAQPHTLAISQLARSKRDAGPKGEYCRCRSGWSGRRALMRGCTSESWDSRIRLCQQQRSIHPSRAPWTSEHSIRAHRNQVVAHTHARVLYVLRELWAWSASREKARAEQAAGSERSACAFDARIHIPATTTAVPCQPRRVNIARRRRRHRHKEEEAAKRPCFYQWHDRFNCGTAVKFRRSQLVTQTGVLQLYWTET